MPDPGVKKAPDTDPQHCLKYVFITNPVSACDKNGKKSARIFGEKELQQKALP
jgi:hypothetical protein